ncbi:MAG: hypothetical protein ABS902_07800 [Priestia megaterium]|uniref:hypothetical protein n=1 Tax=Solibacillus sp. FSL R7-0668 TaxID=2921688 RepID=UPI0030F8083E
MEGKKYTKAGTDIEEVKRLNASSGSSYNEMLAILGQASRKKPKEEFAAEPLDVNVVIDRTKKN